MADARRPTRLVLEWQDLKRHFRRNYYPGMPMTSLDRQFSRLLDLHQFIYERTGGLIGHRLGRVRMLLLRTRGRKTGETRTAALVYLTAGETFVVVGSRYQSQTKREIPLVILKPSS